MAATEPTDVAVAEESDWIALVQAQGRGTQLWELEVWLRALERFFRIRNLPVGQPHLQALLEHNFLDELNVASEGIQRAKELAYAVIGEERVNLLKFRRYVEESLLSDDERGTYYRTESHVPTPELRLADLLESLGSLLEVQSGLCRLGTLSYFAFKSFGRLLVQSLEHAEILASIRANPFRPENDRIRQAHVARVVRAIPDPLVRRETARLFLGLYRFLRYLELVRSEFVRDGAGKRSLLLFVLIHAEADLFLRFQRGVVLRRLPRDRGLPEQWDSIVFGTGMEMKKVFQKELVDFASLTERETIYIRMEDAHGILTEAFQQGVVTLVQHFEPGLQGKDVFPNFVTKREQSRRLLLDLVSLHRMVAGMTQGGDFEALFRAIRRIERFQQTSLKLLMYRDWNEFETFLEEFRSCKNLKNFQLVTHRFETFVRTLVEEVRKRSVLMPEDVAEIMGEPGGSSSGGERAS